MLLQRFGHPLLILLQRFGHPPAPYRDAQIPNVSVIPCKNILDFEGKMENVLEKDSAKYSNLSQYVKKKVYPEGFTKQDKTTLRKFAKKLLYGSKLESLFYVAKEKDGTALRRLVISEKEKARVFEECHSAPFSGHAGRHINTLRKIKGLCNCVTAFRVSSSAAGSSCH